jgi:hypothetical protein
MRHRRLQHRSFEWLCACFILTPCAVLAQQAPAGAQSSSETAPSAAPARSAPATKGGDDIEPAVDTSPEGASRSSDARADRSPTAGHDAKKQSPRGGAPGKAIDHLELGTTDITGNRELPKVMYIVPWKRSDLGDLTGKPLNSLVDQALEPVDRNEFERSNRYYGAVTAGASTVGSASAGASDGGAPNAGAPNAGAPNPGSSQDVHRTPGAAAGSAVRDER